MNYSKGDEAVTTALLLVDIQNDYFPGGRMAIEGGESALATIYAGESAPTN